MFREAWAKARDDNFVLIHFASRTAIARNGNSRAAFRHRLAGSQHPYAFWLTHYVVFQLFDDKFLFGNNIFHQIADGD